MKIVRLDLLMLLPGLPEGPDPRLDQLMEAVRRSVGVEDCRIRDLGAGPLLTVRYDPAVIGEEEVERLVRATALPLDGTRSEALLSFTKPVDALRAQEIEGWLEDVPGVVSASVNPRVPWIRIEYRRDVVTVHRLIQLLRDGGVDMGAEGRGGRR